MNNKIFFLAIFSHLFLHFHAMPMSPYSYKHKPEWHSPLDEKSVMNRFWSALKSQSQKDKNKAFNKYALGDDFFYDIENYPIQRYQIMAGIFAGANVNYNTSAFVLPALHKAICHNDAALVEALIKNDADPNLLNFDGVPPLFYATTLNAAQLLIKYGANPLIKLSIFGTLLNNINFKSDPALIPYYISLGVNRNDRNTNNDTALIAIIRRCRYDTPALKHLIEAYIDSGISYQELYNAKNEATELFLAHNIDTSTLDMLSEALECLQKKENYHY